MFFDSPRRHAGRRHHVPDVARRADHARGIGNGISLIIFAGIVANLPSALVATLELGRTGALSTVFIILFLAMALGVMVLVVFVERAQRRIPVQYPKRQVGNGCSAARTSHLPLKSTPPA